MHFQQLLLLESYTKLLHLLSSSAAASNVQDISSEVNRMKIGLLGYLAIASQPSTPKHGMSPGPSSPVHSHPTSHPSSPNPSSHPSSRPSSRRSSPPPGSGPASRPGSARSSSSAPPAVDDEDEPTPTASCSETDEIFVITPDPTVISAEDDPTVLSEDPTVVSGDPTVVSDDPTVVSGDPTVVSGDPTVVSGDPTVVSALIVPEISVTPPPRSPSPPAPLPSSGAEATELLVDLLEGEDWSEVWRIWKESRHLLLQEMQDLQLDDDQVSEILNIYCKSIAQTKEGEFIYILNM